MSDQVAEMFGTLIAETAVLWGYLAERMIEAGFADRGTMLAHLEGLITDAPNGGSPLYPEAIKVLKLCRPLSVIEGGRPDC